MSVQETAEQRSNVFSAAIKEGPAGKDTRGRARSYSAALLTLGAAAIHFAVAPDHLNEYLPYGIFFACLGVAQVLLAIVIVVTPSRRLYAGALAGTLAVMGLWLMSRSTGVPIALVPWRPEAVGFPDVTAALLEAVSCLLFILRLRRPSRHRGRIRLAVTTLPALLLGSLAAYAGAGAALSPMPIAYNAAPAVPGQASISVVNLVTPDHGQALKELTLTAAPITLRS